MSRAPARLTSSRYVTQEHLIYLGLLLLVLVCAPMLLLPWPYCLAPFGLVLGGVFIFITLRHPIVGLYLYLIMFLIRPQELFPDVSVMHYPYEKLIGIVVIVSLVFQYIVKGRKFELFDVEKGVLFVLGAAAISVIPAVWVGGAKTEFIIFFKIILACLFTARIVDTERKFRAIMWLYIISIGIIAVTSTYNYYSGSFESVMGIQRAIGSAGQEGSYSDPNSMAATLVLGMPFVLAMMKNRRSIAVKLLLAGLLLACLWTVVITGSRGGMLGCIIMLFLIAVTSKHKAVALIVGIVLVIGAAAVMPQQYVDRFSSIASYNDLEDGTGAAESAQGRIKGLMVGLEILLSRPATGVGIGCFGVYNHEHHGTWLQPHNMVGQLAGELGLLGLIAFGYFIYKLTSNIKFVRSLLRKDNRQQDFNFQMATAAGVAVALLFFLGLFAHNLYRFNWYLIASFVAIMVRLVENRYRSVEVTANSDGLPVR